MPPTFRAACALPLDMHTDTVSDALTGPEPGADGQREVGIQEERQVMRRMIVNALVAVACAGCVAPVMRSTLSAFRAGGYEPALAERFISRIREKITEGLTLAP